MSRLVYTIGYDARDISEIISIVKKYGVDVVIDVRRYTKSSRLPQYSGDSLRKTFEEKGIGYIWFPKLGGYRRFGVDIEDIGIAKCFKSSGFRAYATYITIRQEVREELEKLVNIALSKTTAIMCKEKYPWMCHRKIISDYLVVKGFKVVHIIDADKVYSHRLSRCASVVDNELRYI